MPASGTIYTLSATRNSIGGQSKSWAASGTVACRVDPRDMDAGGEMPVADHLTTTREVTITLPASTTIAATGRIASGGVTYEVLNIRAPRSWEITRRVDCVEVS